MLVQDLGHLDGPVLIFGGPYSNLAATRALIDQAVHRQIPADHMICTGDVVAYCAEPAETVAEIRKSGCVVVAGNCEKQLAAYQMECGCGFAAGTTCDVLSAGWFSHADRAIGAEDRDWMDSLPDIVVFEHFGRHCAVVHGGVSDVARFLWPVSPQSDFMQEISLLRAKVGDIDTIFAGHSGLPFKRSIDGVDWINAGVIGMPPNDAAPQTRFAVMTEGKTEIHSLHYDHNAARAAMQAAGLCQGYDAALLSGIWPSEEVLPSELRRAALASG